MLTHPQIDPVAIQIGPLAIRWYGLMYLVGFAAAYGLGRLRIARAVAGRVTLPVLDDLLFYGVLGVILGGRLGYVLFYKPGYYFAHPLEIITATKIKTDQWMQIAVTSMKYVGQFEFVLRADAIGLRQHFRQT